MKLTIEKKNEIRARLQEYAGRYPSQNKAAASLAGISAATFSALINGKYELISDEMFRRIDAQIGVQRNDEWVLCDTTLFRELSLTMRDAQDYANVAWAISPAGSGKTTTARAYAAANGNVFMVSCSEDMRRGDFIRELARVIGINVSDMSLRAALERVTQYLLTLDRPLSYSTRATSCPTRYSTISSRYTTGWRDAAAWSSSRRTTSAAAWT